MSIARQLSILLAVPLVALVGLGILTRFQLSDTEARSRFIAESQVGSLAALGNISQSFAELRVSLRSHLLATTQAQRAEARAAFDENEQSLTTLLQKYGDALISDERDRRLLSDYRDLSRDYIIEAKRVMSLIEDGRRDEATVLAQMGEELAFLEAGQDTGLLPINSLVMDFEELPRQDALACSGRNSYAGTSPRRRQETYVDKTPTQPEK